MTKAAVIGTDGRTTCMADALRRGGATVYCLADYESPGLKSIAEIFRRSRTSDPDAVAEFAREVGPDLVVVGPEAPLAAGVVDRLAGDLRIPCVGPTRSLARIESSKSFTRELLLKHGIPGAVEFRSFRSLDGLEDYLRKLGEFAVKADGLMGGKGVKVFGDHLSSIEEAMAFAEEILGKGQAVVIEEKVEGEEFSLQSFSDGESVVHTIPVQDHKRAWDGDRGPNTGGMGSYSCADHSLPFLTREQLALAGEINARVVRALQGEVGAAYRGVLYGGFMATADGVRVLEYNARFGDPEAMNVLPLLRGASFLDICEAIASGGLGKLPIAFEPMATVCKYLVPEGYPDRTVKNARIRADSLPASRDELRVYPAAVQKSDGDLVMTGSRAIAFLGMAPSVEQAGQIVEEAIGKIDGPVTHRADIGTRELIEKRVRHLEELRRKPRGETVAKAAV
jgi:phosphoribosylamine--glycine ligase